MTDAQALAELMNRWNEYNAKWVGFFGTDKGFSEWFSQQVGIK